MRQSQPHERCSTSGAADQGFQGAVYGTTATTSGRIGTALQSGTLRKSNRCPGRCKRGSVPIAIDEDARQEYWSEVRAAPERVHEAKDTNARRLAARRLRQERYRISSNPALGAMSRQTAGLASMQ